MSSYIEVGVPLKQDAEWFRDLRVKMSERGIDVKWQNSHYHITLAFIYKFADGYSRHAPLFQSVVYRAAPSLTFDKVEAFTTKSGHHVIYLTSTSPSEKFTEMVECVRETVDRLGCEYAPEFKLHVTLGRVDAKQISLNDLKQAIREVCVPSFTLRLFNARYLEYQTHKVYDSCTMFPDKKSAEEAYEERKRQAFRNAFGNIQLYTDPEKFQ